MSTPPLLSRRVLLAGLWMAGSGPLWARPRAGDQGLGGTGAAPQPEPEDRGIGGTGYSGLIQRFGSIVVNDERITYPRGVPVRIDGMRRPVSALRVGHMARVVAWRDPDGRLATRRIDVVSEVVGPIERIAAGELTVLGQTVALAAAQKGLRRGLRVAVYGLRRLDGVIVAGLVEPRRSRRDRVAGPLERDPDGALTIGALRVEGIDPAFAGQRVVVEGSASRGVMQAARARIDDFEELADASRLSIESYAARSGDTLRLGSGQVAQDRARSLPGTGEDRVVIDATRGVDGGLQVEALRSIDRSGPPDPDPRGGPARPGAPGGPGRDPGPPGGPPGNPGPGPAGGPAGPSPHADPGGSPAGPTGAAAPGAPGPGGPRP